jgi:hypothetical protein
LVSVLAVDVDGARPELGETGGGRQAAVDVGTRSAVGGDDAGDDVLLAVDDEAALDAGLGRARADHRGISSPADQQADRLDEHRLAGAGLAGQGGQAVADDEVEGFDHAQLLDVQFVEHQRSARPNLVFNIWWKRRSPKRTNRAVADAAVTAVLSPSDNRVTSLPSTDRIAGRWPRISMSIRSEGSSTSERSNNMCGDTGVISTAR